MSLQVLDTSTQIVIIPSLFMTKGLSKIRNIIHIRSFANDTLHDTLAGAMVKTINILHIPLALDHTVQSHRSLITSYAITMQNDFRSIARPNRHSHSYHHRSHHTPITFIDHTAFHHNLKTSHLRHEFDNTSPEHIKRVAYR